MAVAQHGERFQTEKEGKMKKSWWRVSEAPVASLCSCIETPNEQLCVWNQSPILIYDFLFLNLGNI